MPNRDGLSSPRSGGYSADQEWHFDPNGFLPRVAGVTLNMLHFRFQLKGFLPRVAGVTLDLNGLDDDEQLSSPRCGGYSGIETLKKLYAELSSPRCGGYSLLYCADWQHTSTFFPA